MIETGIKLIFKRWLILMLAYSFARVIFFIYNQNLFDQNTFAEILRAFVHGLRFDTYAILWVNIPFWLLAFVPIEKLRARAQKYWLNIESVLFGLWNLCFLGLSFTDAELYRFQSKRLSLEMASLKGDVTNQAWSMIFYYWGLSLIMIGTTLALIWFYPRRKKIEAKLNWKRTLSLR